LKSLDIFLYILGDVENKIYMIFYVIFGDFM